MRQFYTATLERMQRLSGPFETEPYEAAWASEAIFFVRVHAVEGAAPRFHAQVEISPDGITWANKGGGTLEPVPEPGLYFVRTTHFGGWLRLAGAVEGDQAVFETTIYLSLKE